MRHRWRSVLAAPLSALFILAGPGSAGAVIEPDPDQDPPPALTTSQCLAAGTVTLFPGGKFGYCAFRVSVSIRYHVDVQPNKGTPRAKINIWRWDTSGNNPVLVYGARVTGVNAVDERFTDPGFYQLVARYPLNQMVDGTNLDFMNVTVQVAS